MQYMVNGMQPPVPFMPMPRYLLALPISSTAKILYTVLLSRALISAQNDGWTNGDGRVFQYHTIEELSKTLNKSKRAVQNALNVLETWDLIHREHQAPGRANQIYVKVAQSVVAENCTPGQQNIAADNGKKLHRNYRKPRYKKSDYSDKTGGYETL